MRYVLLIALIGVLAACRQRPEPVQSKPMIRVVPVLMPDSLYTELITFLLANDSNVKGCVRLVMYDANFSISQEDSVQLITTDHLLTSKDLDFMHSQLIHADEFKLDKDSIAGKMIIPTDTYKAFHKPSGLASFWEKYEKAYGKGSYCSIGKPLFSLDGKTVIVSTGYICGSMCGSGATSIYRRVSNKWIKIKEISTWIT